MKKQLLIAVFSLAAASTAIAGGDVKAGCNERVRRGDTQGEVLSNCGSPSYTYQENTGSVNGGHVVGGQVVGGSVDIDTVDVLIYDIGSNHQVFKVYLRGGKVIDAGKEKP